MSMWGERRNPKKLRVIKTGRSEKAINAAAEQGFWPLVKPVICSPEIKNKLRIFQNRQTGKIRPASDFRDRARAGEVLAIDWLTYYPNPPREPFAAYLLPPDLQPGEHVWLDDLMEDVIGARWNQGNAYRLMAGEAVWTGTEFRLLFEEHEVIQAVG